MPYYHCYNCHHEFEMGKAEKVLCDWCGSEAYTLEEKTPLEKMVKDIEKEGGFDKWWKKIMERVEGEIKDGT